MMLFAGSTLFTMIILNERRDIIMNKVIPVKQILPFLDNYEKNGHH